MSCIVVTGGAGFIGSNLVASLCAEGRYEVVVCDRLRTASGGKWRNIAKHPIAEVVEPDQLSIWLDAHRDEIAAVVHMGAISSTMEDDADLVVRVNFSLSKRIWDWCSATQVPLIYASSAATYGDGALGFSDPDDLSSLSALRPRNVYGWSKALFDIYARRSADKGRAPPQWVGLKFFNVYGPNEYHKGPMKSVAAQIWPLAREGRQVRLFKSHSPHYADGGQMRDFVYVKDVEKVVSWLLREPKVSGIYNLGSGAARSFRDLAEATFAAAGHPADIGYVDTPEALRPGYQYFTEADMSRLRKVGYAGAFTPLEEGITDYAEAYLAAGDPYR